MHLCVVDGQLEIGETNFILKPFAAANTNFTAMYALRNKVQLIGNLGNAPEVRNTESGKKLAKFSIATNEIYRNAQGEKVTETQWHNLIAWGKTAEIVEKYLAKGSEVVIEGKLINRNYTDKEGNKKYVTEVEVSELLMLGSKSK
jgi:single-strand DNA-binding protein